jgi:hypothetical protein
MELALIAPGQVALVIPALLPFLQESQKASRGRVTADDILRFVLNGQMQLWAVHNAGYIHGHVVTEIKQYPQCKMFVVQYAAMKPGTLAQIEDVLQDTAQKFAKDAGCAGIEFVGRPGWAKTADKYGYAVQSVMYQKFFEGSK